MKNFLLVFLCFFGGNFNVSAERESISSCSQPTTGNNYALFFAVDQYDSLQNLQNPVKDAHSIAKELNDHYDFKTEVVENPTMDEIEKKLKEYKTEFASGRYSPEGQLLIFFSGHGMIENKNGFFLARDSDPGKLHNSAFLYEYWRPFINSIDCKHILVALDACFSGTFDPGWWDRADRLRKPTEPSEREWLLINHKRYDTRIFFSSATDVKSPDDSNFAKKFLAGLRSWGGDDAILSSTELFSHLELASPKPHFGDFGKNEPGSSFLFIVENPLNNIHIDPKETETLEVELKKWKSVKDINTVDAYRTYLEEYPDGEFRGVAISNIRKLQEAIAIRREQIDWEVAKEKNTKEGYLKYQRNYPSGMFFEDATVKIEALNKPVMSDAPKGMILVEGGTFERGDIFGDGNGDERPVHEVEVSSFYLGINEVTSEEFTLFCSSTGRDKTFPGQGKIPVSNISWYDAVEYCNWRSKEEGFDEIYQIDRRNRDQNNTNLSISDKKWTVSINWSANGYRLPTEAEWEYAARSRGIIEKYPGTSNQESLNKYVGMDIYSRTSGIDSVGSFKPNKLGFFDMTGNVSEWCWDWYDREYYETRVLKSKDIARDPRGPEKGSERIYKGGGGRGNEANNLRVSKRNKTGPDSYSSRIGFRLAKSTN